MKKHFTISKISILLVFVVFALLYSSSFAQFLLQPIELQPITPTTTGPSSNPPGGAITPTFSGLNVNGNIDMKGSFKNTYVQSGTAYPVMIDDSLQVTGDVSLGGNLTLGYGTAGAGKINAKQIGSFYRRLGSGNSGSASASCDVGSVITGCSGNSNNVFRGTTTTPTGNTCFAYSNSGDVYARAFCFDPTGATKTST